MLHAMQFLIDMRRVLIPLVLAAVCMVVSGWVSPVFAWLLVVVTFGLALDALLSLMPHTGSLESHRQ